MPLTKEEVEAIQNLLAKWGKEIGLPIAWRISYLQHASEQLIANDEQLKLLARVAKDLCPVR